LDLDNNNISNPILDEIESLLERNRNRPIVANRVVGTAMAFRDLKLPTGTGRLPVYVLENILNHAYDTQATLGLYDTIELIQPILEREEGVTRAGRHKRFRSPKD